MYLGILKTHLIHPSLINGTKQQKSMSDLKTNQYQMGAEAVNIPSAFIKAVCTLPSLCYLKVTPHRMKNFTPSQSSESLPHLVHLQLAHIPVSTFFNTSSAKERKGGQE